MSVTVPRRPGHKTRTVTLAIRFAAVRFGPPAHQIKYRGQSEEIALWAISAQEENPQPGCEATRAWTASSAANTTANPE